MTTNANERYNELRKVQKQNLDVLYPMTAAIKELQRIKKDNKDKPDFDMKNWKADFRLKKDTQLNAITNLNEINRELKLIRPLIKKDKVERIPKIKQEKSVKIKKEIKPNNDKKPKKSWTVPLLSEHEVNTMKLMNNIFASNHKKIIE